MQQVYEAKRRVRRRAIEKFAQWYQYSTGRRATVRIVTAALGLDRNLVTATLRQVRARERAREIDTLWSAFYKRAGHYPSDVGAQT